MHRACCNTFVFVICLSVPIFAQKAPPTPVVSNNTIPQPANGALQGKVIDDTGKPVAGAVITLRHFFQVQGRDQQAISKNDGTFLISQLPSGDYSQCTKVPNSDYVDDCEWNLSFQPRVLSTPSPTQIGPAVIAKAVFAGDLPHTSERIVVPPQATSAVQMVRVRKGARVTVRLIDPSGLIDGKSTLFVGALSPVGMLIPAMPTTKGPVVTYEQVIPLDTKVRLVVNNSSLIASSARGNTPLGAGGVTQVSVAAKDPPLVINYTIVGRNSAVGSQ